MNWCFTCSLLRTTDHCREFFPCLRVKFHKSSFWVHILAAGGPYNNIYWAARYNRLEDYKKIRRKNPTVGGKTAQIYQDLCGWGTIHTGWTYATGRVQRIASVTEFNNVKPSGPVHLARAPNATVHVICVCCHFLNTGLASVGRARSLAAHSWLLITVCGLLTLVVGRHFSLTVQTSGYPWRHWG